MGYRVEFDRLRAELTIGKSCIVRESIQNLSSKSVYLNKRKLMNRRVHITAGGTWRPFRMVDAKSAVNIDTAWQRGGTYNKGGGITRVISANTLKAISATVELVGMPLPCKPSRLFKVIAGVGKT